MQEPPGTIQFGAVLALALCLFALPQAAAAASEDIPVTDPDTLETLGFERDATNVYVAPGVDLYGTSGDDLMPASEFQAGVTGYATVWALDFKGNFDGTGQGWRYAVLDGFDLIWRGNGGSGQAFRMDAQITGLPHNGKLDWFRGWWQVDQELAAGITSFLYEFCQPSVSRDRPRRTLLAVLSSTEENTPAPSNEGSDVASLGGRNISAVSCSYIVRVRFSGIPVVQRVERLHKLRVQFRYPDFADFALSGQ